VGFFLAKMHVHKVLSVLKDWAPCVWSRGFLLQLLVAAAVLALLAPLHS